jgi:hypothetical protein
MIGAKPRRILVTGGNAGIGLALAQSFAGRHQLLLSGRKSAERSGRILIPARGYVVADQIAGGSLGAGSCRGHSRDLRLGRSRQCRAQCRHRFCPGRWHRQHRVQSARRSMSILPRHRPGPGTVSAAGRSPGERSPLSGRLRTRARPHPRLCRLQGRACTDSPGRCGPNGAAMSRCRSCIRDRRRPTCTTRPVMIPAECARCFSMSTTSQR